MGCGETSKGTRRFLTIFQINRNFKSRTGFIFGSILILIIVVGPLLPSGVRSLFIDIMIFSIYAMAYDVLYGYSNQFSYGHALFFGLGAYGILLPIIHMNVDLWTGLAIAIFICVIFGLSLGFFSVRIGGAYFVILTIILNMIFYLLALSWTWLTGGDDGLTFTVPPVSFVIVQFSVYEPLVNYYLVFTFFIVSYLILKRFVESPIGKILIAIRENEERAQLLGYNTFRYKLLAFVVSALFTGMAGALFAIRTRYASAEYFSLVISADAIIWTLVGGTGTLVGPIIGVAVILPLVYYVGVFWKHYLIIIGALMILILRVSPKGILGFIMSKLKVKV